MKKEKKIILGKTNYLLGEKDGEKIWLVAPSWDCGWYWGFGYLEAYGRRFGQLDITTHTHFDSEILNNGKTNAFNYFKEYFTKTPLTDSEIWLLCDYMQTFYTLRKTAETFRHGYSYFTGKAKIDDLQRTDLEKEINQNMLPKLFKEIEKLLTPNEN